METRSVVLFIDREPKMLEAVADVFAGRKDLHVLLAGSFDLAEQYIDVDRLDVVVADVRVPGSGIGKGFIARVVARHPHIGLVLVSADPVRYLQNYPAHAICLEKPFSTNDLQSAIKEARRRAP